MYTSIAISNSIEFLGLFGTEYSLAKRLTPCAQPLDFLYLDTCKLLFFDTIRVVYLPGTAFLRSTCCYIRAEHTA